MAGRRGSDTKWLVTGASSGIGLALVRMLHDEGLDPIATGRRPAHALPADFPDVTYIAAELSSAEGRTHLLDALPGPIDFALLNAGAGFFRPLDDETPAAIEEVFSINLLAPIALCHGLYPHLNARGGLLGLVGSVAHKGAAGMPVYAASKSGLDGFGRSLRSEWQGRVDVRVIHPGPTATGMAERAGMQSRLAARLMLPVESVACGVLRAMRGRRFARRTISYRAVAVGTLLGAGRRARAR